MSDFRTVDRDTPFLLPPSIQDWLPENHLARFVVEVVERLDLRALYASYSGKGSSAYDPGMLLALLFYGYATGVFSSRKLEKASYENIAVRYICAGRHPDHDTIADFRIRVLRIVGTYFTEILLIAQKMGFKGIGNISIDGTKVRANASKHKAMSYGHAVALKERIEAEVQELLLRAEKVEQEEQMHLDIPHEIELREERLQRISEAIQVIEYRAAERDAVLLAEHAEKMARRTAEEEKTGRKKRSKPPSPPKTGPRDGDQFNFTDPESRIMLESASGGFGQCYNAQLAVDQESMLIVGVHVSVHPNDKQQLVPTMESIPAELGSPVAVAADAGYFSKQNIEECDERNVEAFIAPGREAHHRTIADLLAPAMTLEQLRSSEMPDCSPAEAMKLKLGTVEGRLIYGRRKSTVEPVNGIIKQALGFRQFLLRGLWKTDHEFNLVSAAYNLKRLFSILQCREAPA